MHETDSGCIRIFKLGIPLLCSPRNMPVRYGDYTKYMSGGKAGGNGYEQFLSQYAGKYMSGDKAADKAPAAHGSTQASPMVLAATAAQPSHANAEGGQMQPSNYQQYLQGHGSQGGDFTQYMKQYAGDYDKYAKNAQGSQGGDFSKFMNQYASDYQQYMQGHGSQGGGDDMDFQKWMQGRGAQGRMSRMLPEGSLATKPASAQIDASFMILQKSVW